METEEVLAKINQLETELRAEAARLDFVLENEAYMRLAGGPTIGRDCKRPPVSDGVELALQVAAYAVTLLAVVAGFVHLAARCGWI